MKGAVSFFHLKGGHVMLETCKPAFDRRDAVVLRLYETGCLSEGTCQRLLFNGPGNVSKEKYQEIFQRMLSSYIQESGYTKLQKPTNKKGIRDFPQILREAENRGIFSPEKAAKLRDELEIPKINPEEIRLDGEGLE